MTVNGTCRKDIGNRPTGFSKPTQRELSSRTVIHLVVASDDLAHARKAIHRRTLHQVRARDRSGREYAQARSLNDTTAIAIDEALRMVAAMGPEPHVDAGIDVAFASAGDAVFARKRLNEALAVRELLDDVEAWVWESGLHVSAPLTEAGRQKGFELRIRRRTT